MKTDKNGAPGVKVAPETIHATALYGPEGHYVRFDIARAGLCENWREFPDLVRLAEALGVEVG